MTPLARKAYSIDSPLVTVEAAIKLGAAWLDDRAIPKESEVNIASAKPPLGPRGSDAHRLTPLREAS